MKNEILEVIEEFEGNKRELNIRQLEHVKGKFNTPLKFEYAEGNLCHMFKGTEQTINGLKHFGGFEYEKSQWKRIFNKGMKF